jgi:hypothetical protein
MHEIMIACTRLADEVLSAFALLVKKRKVLMKTREWRHKAFTLLCATSDL